MERSSLRTTQSVGPFPFASVEAHSDLADLHTLPMPQLDTQIFAANKSRELKHLCREFGMMVGIKLAAEYEVEAAQMRGCLAWLSIALL